MPKPDERKREEMLVVAERLFASRPFHEVRLEDVAAEVRVSKGTIYTYFDSKEDLYVSVLRHGMSRLIGELEPVATAADQEPAVALRGVVFAIVSFAERNRPVFELARKGQLPDSDPEMDELLGRMFDLIAGLLRRGVAAGHFVDPNPEWTCHLITGFVQSIFDSPGVAVPPADRLADHVAAVILKGLEPRRRA